MPRPPRPDDQEPLSPEENRYAFYVNQLRRHLKEKGLKYEFVPATETTNKLPRPGLCFVPGHPEQLTPLGEKAAWYFTQLQEHGLIACHGILLSTDGGTFGDFNLSYYLCQNIQDENLVETIMSGSTVMACTAQLGDSGTPVGVEHRSLVVSYLEDIASFIKPAQEMRDQSTSELANLASHLTQEGRSGKVMTLLHDFCSASSSRGHKLPLKMFMALPEQLGIELGKEVAQNPLVMEALSELIIVLAGDDLAELSQPTGVQQGFRFPRLYDRQDPSTTRMHEKGITREPLGLFSIYK